MEPKKSNTSTKKGLSNETQHAHADFQDRAIEVQKHYLEFYLDAAQCSEGFDPKVFEFVRLAPYCMAAIGQGIGFQKDRPIEGMRAFDLSVILNLLGIQIEKVLESSTNLGVLEGGVTVKWTTKEKTLDIDLYCVCQTHHQIMEFIDDLQSETPF